MNDETRAYIREVVDRAPELTADQHDAVSRILNATPVERAQCVPECTWLETRQHADGCEPRN